MQKKQRRGIEAIVRRTFALLVPLVAALGCLGVGGGKFGALGATCPQLSGSGDPLQANFSANAQANAKVRVFVAAAKDLVNVSVEMENTAAKACRNMGRDLGIPPNEMRGAPDEPGAEARIACSTVAAKIDSILQQGINVSVQATPPSCQANARARARCEGACNVELDPGEIVARCEPAKLSGFCRGTCNGRCEGTCRGNCEGTCRAKGPNGKCAGQCQGKCHGQCDATCHAHCDGEWQAPKCEADIRPPSADADCQGACNARAEFRAECTPAQVEVETGANTELAMKLASTLRQNLPALLRAQIALGQRLLDSAETVVEVGAELPEVVGDAGAQAVACVAAATNASVRATARIRVSVEASAQVSGKVGAAT